MANNGLSHRFRLVNGKFELTSGANKTKDGLHFLFCFNIVPRIYLDSFCPRVLWLVQKTGSFVLSYKPLLLGRLRSLVLRYVPNIRLDGIDFYSTRNVNNDNAIEVVVNYTYVGDDGVKSNDKLSKII
jgi:hypothetical protein